MIGSLRMRELAEQAISYLQDNGILNDFLEDRDIELSEEEREYFCIGEEDEDYED